MCGENQLSILGVRCGVKLGRTYSYNFHEATGGRPSLTMDELLSEISTHSFHINNIVISF